MRVPVASVVSVIDILASSKSNFNIITLDHVEVMKNISIIGNIGQLDNDLDFAGLEGLEA